MTHVIAVVNRKGGCAKTTTTLSLASALALMGKRVTVVDVDSQCDATKGLGIVLGELEPEQLTVADAFLRKRKARDIEMRLEGRLNDNLWVVPGNRGLTSVKMRLDQELAALSADDGMSEIEEDSIKDEQRQRLRKSIDSLRGERDFVLIDTGPEMAFAQMSALIASDFYLVPVMPSGYDLSALEQILKHVKQIRKRYQPNLSRLGVLLAKTKRSKLDRDTRPMLEAQLDTASVFTSEIGDYTAHREATMAGLTIHEHAPGSPASTQYMALAEEILQRLATEPAATSGAKEVAHG